MGFWGFGVLGFWAFGCRDYQYRPHLGECVGLDDIVIDEGRRGAETQKLAKRYPLAR